MKTRRVRVAFSRKVHPRPFNPVETTMEEIVDVEPGEDPRDVRRAVYKRIKADVDKISERILTAEAE